MKPSMLLDHHMHSEFSDDSTQNIEELVLNAIKDNKKFITFTDHSDLINLNFDGAFCTDIPSYNQRIAELQQTYPEITILRGSEIGFEKTIATDIQSFIDTHQFDITIVSIHSILGGKDIADEMRASQAWVHSPNLLQDYYEATLDALTMLTNINILGHLDYALRYIPNGAELDLSPYKELFYAVFEMAIKKDIALDFNTAGIRYGLPFAHPQPYLLSLYHDAGGKLITLGSDAHRAKDVNFGFIEAIQLLTELKFDAITTFELGYPQQLSFSNIK